MQVTVSARHVEVSDALREAAESKIGRLDRFLEGMERAEVHFFEERNPRIQNKDICEVTMEGHGHHVRTKVAAPDCFAAVDGAVEKLEHQLHKLKTKLHRRHHPKHSKNGNHAAVEPLDPNALAEFLNVPVEVTSEDEKPIVKVKNFPMKPMTLEEAQLQLELLNHSFYLFHNADTGHAAVLYWRDDGDLGLIESPV